MSDKKLTDEEIIKAIGNLFKNTDGRYELAIKNSTKGVCGEKQYYCIPNGVYDLIMRQSSFIDRQKSEIERLKTTIDSFTDIGKLYSEIKAEAYKEFAKMLKKRIYNGGVHPTVEDEFICKIDTLLKEMVGEEE